MSAAEPVQDPGLRDYLRLLRRRKGAVILCVAVVMVVELASSFLQTPIYEATAEMLLQQRTGESLFGSNTGQQVDPSRLVQTQIRVLGSRPVRAEVRAKLGIAPPVSATPVGQTDVIDVSVRSTDAKRAADSANAYVAAYIDLRRKQAVDDSFAAAQQVNDKINSLQNQIGAFENQVNSAPAAQQAAVRQSITSQRDAVVRQQGLFKEQLDQLQVEAALKSGGAQVVSAADPPGVPISPRPLRNGVLAFGLGLVFGISLAFFLEYLDDSVKSKDDFARITRSFPVIGLIPAISEWKVADEPMVVSLLEPKSPAAEAYRALRTSIQFLALERPMRTLQITSPGAREGKTTTLCNLAVALAGTGLRVIVVCCDLRRPRVHDFFGLDNKIGFTSVLLGKVGLTAALQPVPNQPRLSVLASGPLPPNPSELLSSKRTIEVLTSLQAEADIVLVDSPPILPVTDALVLSGRVDATILVCVAGATTRKDAARAVELLEQVDAPMVGAVLNGVTGEGAYGYGYGYYRYESDAPAPGRSRTRGREPRGPEEVTSRKR